MQEQTIQKWQQHKVKVKQVLTKISVREENSNLLMEAEGFPKVKKWFNIHSNQFRDRHFSDNPSHYVFWTQTRI